MHAFTDAVNWLYNILISFHVAVLTSLFKKLNILFIFQSLWSLLSLKASYSFGVFFALKVLETSLQCFTDLKCCPSYQSKRGAVTPVQDYCEWTPLIFFWLFSLKCCCSTRSEQQFLTHPSQHILLNTSFSEIFVGHKKLLKIQFSTVSSSCCFYYCNESLVFFQYCPPVFCFRSWCIGHLFLWCMSSYSASSISGDPSRSVDWFSLHTCTLYSR